MKITGVRAIRADYYCFAKIMTDEGLYGIGESGAFGNPDAAAAQINSYGEYLIGKDPLEIEHHWQVLFRGLFFRGSVAMGALSAIDIALWDIAGKYFNVPVYQLLGGKCREKIRVYGQVFAKTDEELVEECQRKISKGFTALGHLSPFLDEPKRVPYNKTYIKNMDDSIRRVHQIREAAGDNIDLCLELHRRCLPAEAVAFIHEIEDVHPLFVEDPIPPGNMDAMAYVVHHSRVPVATGERLHTIYEFQELLDRQAANYTRVSLTTAGGFTGAKKIAAMAEARMCPIIPHNPLSPVCTAAEMQFCAAIDNLLICEYPDGDDLLDGVHRKCELVTRWDYPVNGYVIPSSLPGIGIDLAADAEHMFPPCAITPGSRLNEDGSVRDQ